MHRACHLFTWIILALAIGISSVAHADIDSDWKYLETKLKKNGFDSNFIAKLKEAYEPDEFQNVVELNLLLFLKKGDVHGKQANDEAVEHVREFLSEHEDEFESAEKEQGVPREVIASLLWIESRHGQRVGRFQIASVFADLVQSDRPDVIRHLKTDGAHRFSKKPSRRDLRKIAGRAKKKAKWALGELKALARISKKGGNVFEIRGSFAGAFGMPQFLPSSYARWAKSQKPGQTPDLTHAGDAIQSVAFYLHDNGWRKRQKSHERALLNYNNSRDYARAILKLAKNAKANPRAPAGDVKAEH